jgi:RimJ/RimL family protein N-acetyltransferase
MPDALLTGPRVYIRLMTIDDAKILATADLLESETWHSEHGRVPTSTMAFEVSLRSADKHDLPTKFNLAICLNETDECIGSTMIRDIDWINRTAETGTRIFLDVHRNSGFGSEAKHISLRYAFHVLGLHAIRSDVYSANTRSAAALAKQGYKPAGRIRAEVCRNGVYRDSLLFDLLRPDWEAAYADWKSRYE